MRAMSLTLSLPLLTRTMQTDNLTSQIQGVRDFSGRHSVCISEFTYLTSTNLETFVKFTAEVRSADFPSSAFSYVSIVFLV